MTNNVMPYTIVSERLDKGLSYIYCEGHVHTRLCHIYCDGYVAHKLNSHTYYEGYVKSNAMSLTYGEVYCYIYGYVKCIL